MATANPEPNPQIVQRRRFDDSEEMASYLEGWSIEFTQIEAGRFTADHVVAGGGPVLLQGGRTDRALVQRGVCPSRLTVCLSAENERAWVVRGREAPGNEVTVLRPGEEINVHTDAGFPICSISVDLHHFRTIARRMGVEGLADSVMQVRSTRPGELPIQELRSAWGQLAAGPTDRTSPTAARQWKNLLEVDLVHILARALQAAGGPAEQAAVRATERVIAGVERALNERPRHVFSVRELAASIGVSERTLRRVIRDWYGAPLTTIDRARRLHGARRELRSTRRGPKSVTGVAMAWGFEHLGRFAGDYRSLFDESPSQTLARARR